MALQANWGTEGPAHSIVRPGDEEASGPGNVVTVGGRDYYRMGSISAIQQQYAGPGDIINDPRWGTLLSLDALSRVPSQDGGFWDGPGPVLLAGGMLAGVAAPAFAAGAGAEGAAGAAGLEGTAGAGELIGGAGADLLSGAEATSGAASGGTGTGGFSWTDPSTWSNPFSNMFGGNSLPPGTTTVGQNLFDTGGDPSEFYPSGGDKPVFNADGLSGGSSGGASNLSSLLGGNPWLNAAGSLGSGLLQYLASQNAAGAQTDAANQANATLWAMYNQNRADLEPWRTAGTGALGNLTNLTTPGKQLDTAMLDPGYDFRYQQGLDQLDNRLRQGGKFYSGDALRGGQEYAQNFATGEFSNVFNRNAALAGIGQTAVNTGVNAGANTANAVSGNQIGAGNARASGYVGGANAIGGAFTGYLNNQNQNNLMLALLGRGY